MHRRELLIAGLTVAALVLPAGCGGGDGPRPALTGTASASPANGVAGAHGGRFGPAGHQRMIEELKRVAEQGRIDNPFLGEKNVEKLREIAAGLDQVPPDKQPEILGELGKNELRLGHTEAGVKAFEALEQITRDRSMGGPSPALFYLGLAWMRFGENQNCVNLHNEDSCILPIKGGGIHRKPEGSRNAIEVLRRNLDRGPDPASRWLLNVAYMTIGEYPDKVPPEHLIPPSAFASDEAFPRFLDVAPKEGLNAFGLAGGAIADDFDGDGRLDVVYSDMALDGQLRFFHNNGDRTFSDRTEAANLLGIVGGLNVIHGDFDNNGAPDLLVLRGGWMREHGRMPKSLLRNDGHGVFTDVTFDAGLAEVNYPTQAAACDDYDRDGDLDIYVGSESGKAGYPSQLFRNNGDGTFTDVAPEAGVDNIRFAKGVAWGDYDGDDDPDLYVSNIGKENRLYRNNGDGTFTDVAPELGVTNPIDSFATWFWDFNNDGALDIYATTYYQAPGPERVRAYVASLLGQPGPGQPPSLYAGDGKGHFRDVAVEQGLTRIEFPMGSNFGDLDNDGWLDFYLATGFPEYEGLIPNAMYRNRGGTGFADVTTAGGFGHLQKGHGVSFVDLDEDGDEDVLTRMGGALPGDGFRAGLFENPGFGRHWIAIHFVGTKSNRSAIGTRVRIDVTDGGKRRSIYRWVTSGSSFGGNPLRLHVGLGAATTIETLEIHWPTSKITQTFHDVPADGLIRIVEGEDRIASEHPASAPVAAASR